MKSNFHGHQAKTHFEEEVEDNSEMAFREHMKESSINLEKNDVHKS